MSTSPDPTDASASIKKRAAALPQGDVPHPSLIETLKVARAIADNLGKAPSSPLQVAKALGVVPTAGGFREVTGASIAYGITEGGAWAETISLTDLGRRVVAPTEEGDDVTALREAVLRPRVTRLFLEKYNGSKWPRDDIGQNVLEDLGVAAAQTARALQLVRADAEHVGFLVEINGAQFVELGGPAPRTNTVAAGAPDTGALASIHSIVPESESKDLDVPVPGPLPTTGPSRVFVSHGRNDAIVKQLKKILTFGNFEPVVSVENQTGAKPVPDKVMDDMRSCDAGIVHVGSEKKVLDTEGNEHDMLNSNVLIEIGAAMALYGRNFVLLVERGVKLPSNLQGLYEVRFDGGTLDYEATMSLLEAFNSFKRAA